MKKAEGESPILEGKHSFVMLTPIGPLTGVEECGAITALSFGGVPEAQQAPTPLLAELAKQLAEYFLGQRREFTLPLAPQGTPWQHRVWDALLQIPYGQITTYGRLAEEAAQRMKRERMSAQAVGSAVGHNPISIIIPCHRVLGTDGGLRGYAGGIEIKASLLEHEGVTAWHR